MTNIYKFGPHTISAGQVFLKTKYSIGLVNLKPILPGHVLVVSLRPVRRFLDLDPEEVSDMFQSAQRIGQVIEKEYGGSSLTIACQDGLDAGQSVPHVHVHIIPRRLGDFANNDDIYDDIARNTKEYMTKDTAATSKKGVDNEERIPRTEPEMAAEASRLALLLEQQQRQC